MVEPELELPAFQPVFFNRKNLENPAHLEQRQGCHSPSRAAAFSRNKRQTLRWGITFATVLKGNVKNSTKPCEQRNHLLCL